MRNRSISAEEQPLKILHVITTIDRGGAEKALLALVSQQKKMGLDSTIFVLKGNLDLKDDFIQLDCPVVSKVANRNVLKQLFFLWKNVERFDILHCHLPRAEVLGSLTHRNIPIVVTKHNSESMLPKNSGLGSRILGKFVYGRASQIICISSAVRDFLVSKSELPDNLKKVNVVYYGIQDSEFPLKPRGTNEMKIKIGTIARLEPQKNLFFFLDIISNLHQTFPNLRAEIVGSGSLEKPLKSRIQELGLEDCVSLRSKIADVDSFYDSLDLFLFTSNYEGFGLVLLEAMNHKIPVVASKVSAIPEVLGDRHPGLVEANNLIAFVSTITNIFRHSADKLRLLNYQDKRLPLFSLDKYERSTFQIYQNVVVGYSSSDND